MREVGDDVTDARRVGGWPRGVANVGPDVLVRSEGVEGG